MLATLLDSVGGLVTGLAVLPDWVVTADLSVRTWAPSQGSRVHGDARLLRRGRSTAIGEVLLHDGDPASPIGAGILTSGVLTPDFPLPEEIGEVMVPAHLPEPDGGHAPLPEWLGVRRPARRRRAGRGPEAPEPVGDGARRGVGDARRPGRRAHHGPPRRRPAPALPAPGPGRPDPRHRHPPGSPHRAGRRHRRGRRRPRRRPGRGGPGRPDQLDGLELRQHDPHEVGQLVGAGHEVVDLAARRVQDVLPRPRAPPCRGRRARRRSSTGPVVPGRSRTRRFSVAVRQAASGCLRRM